MGQLRSIPVDHWSKRSGFHAIVILMSVAVILASCNLPNGETATPEPERIYVEAVRFGEPIQMSAAPFRTGGFPSNEKCMAGDYYHPYTIETGRRAGEVWLCCVPVDELLRESFWCAADNAELVTRLGLGSADDLKVQYCQLYDALSEELKYTPACIPAPLEVESEKIEG